MSSVHHAEEVYLDLRSPLVGITVDYPLAFPVTDSRVVHYDAQPPEAPETVTAVLERKYETMGGFGKLAAGFQFGTMPPELVEKNLRLYADEVMPEVRKF